MMTLIPTSDLRSSHMNRPMAQIHPAGESPSGTKYRGSKLARPLRLEHGKSRRCRCTRCCTKGQTHPIVHLAHLWGAEPSSTIGIDQCQRATRMGVHPYGPEQMRGWQHQFVSNWTGSHFSPPVFWLPIMREKPNPKRSDRPQARRACHNLRRAEPS